MCNFSSGQPKAGRFQSVSEVPFTQQINLKPALISRFDVIWLMTDQPAAEHDKLIAEHIMSNRAESTPEILIEQGSEVDPSKAAKYEGVDASQGIVNRDLIKCGLMQRDLFTLGSLMKHEELSENSMLKREEKVENLTTRLQSLQEQ